MSSADEIRKLKELFDAGAITQEEFDGEKRRLLGGAGPDRARDTERQRADTMRQPPRTYPSPEPSQKRRPGCLVWIAVLVGLIVGLLLLSLILNGIFNTPEDNVVFDAMRFYTSDGITVTEEELIAMLGEPDEIEEWEHTRASKTYPIRSLRYEPTVHSFRGHTYSYDFNNGVLHRIVIGGVSYEYANKGRILSMFGLKRYANSTTVRDNGVVYRVTNCGVYELCITKMTKNTVGGRGGEIRISYSEVFGG